jgi:hypothetical protein
VFARYVRGMDEARAVIERLERIEALEREGATPELVLAEVQELLREGEEWIRAERDGTDSAAEALECCRLALNGQVVPVA